MKESASGLRTRLSTDLTSALGARPRVALMTGISRCQFDTQTAAAACSAYPSGKLTWTDLQSVDRPLCYSESGGGAQRCGSNSSMRLAGCVGSRSSTSLKYA